MTDEIKETGCCPKFDPAPWHEKVFEWQNKKFIKASVFTLFHYPVNFGSVIAGMMKQIGLAGGQMVDGVCLSDHTSMWNMDLYLAVDRDIPGADNVVLNGTFLSKVYEGPYKDTAKWCDDFKAYAASKNMKITKWFMWYTTCPKCAKAYGKNYVAVVARCESSVPEN